MMIRTRTLFVAVAAGALLAGCFGSDDDDVSIGPDPVVRNEVPDSALTSVAAFTAYVGSLPLSETAEPVDISKITVAPNSDSLPPAPV